jgi:hypothetical protein
MRTSFEDDFDDHEDMNSVLEKQESFLGFLDAMITCTRVKKYPFGRQVQYIGHVTTSTVVLKSLASYDLWITYSFFGMVVITMRSTCFNAPSYLQD